MEKRANGRLAKVDLQGVVHSAYPSLPENQRKVADFFLHNAAELPFLSVVDIEKRSGASKATVVRVAQNLGFSGFLELRTRLMETVQSQMQLPGMFHLLSKSDRNETLTMVAHQDVKNINQTINNLDRKVFGEVVEMILQAQHVYTAGLGISSLMAQILSYSLNQVAIRARPFVHDYETFLEQIAFVTPNDLLIALSFPPYSRETIDLVKTAAERKIPVVGIVNKLTAPIAFFAQKVIPIRSENMIFTNSFSAISVVINALATEVARRNEKKALKNLRQINRLLTETGHYTEE